MIPNTDRRNLLRVVFAFVELPGTILNLGCKSDHDRTHQDAQRSPDRHSTGAVEETDSIAKGHSMQIQYLEIVTPDVDAVCHTYSALYGVAFGDADPNLGGARTAKLAGGGVLGVRPPMRDTENPVVRPYVLVEDIQASVDAAAQAGAQVALPPMEIAGHGTCAIIIEGGIESGLWQL